MTAAEHIERLGARAHAVRSRPYPEVERVPARERFIRLADAITAASQWVQENQDDPDRAQVIESIYRAHRTMRAAMGRLGIGDSVPGQPEFVGAGKEDSLIEEGTFPGSGPKLSSVSGVIGAVLRSATGNYPAGGLARVWNPPGTPLFDRPVVRVTAGIGVLSVVGVGVAYLYGKGS